MFRGAAKVTLDVKGRMVLPTRVRETLAKGGDHQLVATVDRDQCVMVYPLRDWQKLQDDLLNLPNLHSETRWLQRLMVGYATDLEIDSHGRVLIPAELREFTGLQRDALLLGQGNHLELWDESAWKQASLASMKPDLRTSAVPAGLNEVKLSAGLPGTPPEQK
ncbi:MAG TPA: division/cell wall cluster transcriptional repressor MraZ [Steroidobacteraceae bacterium]|jgi:MraZ protein|nr:division/cell wall cluster transcriptional repressor MraZ [Steroidobacteraceae bacterium]